MSASASAPAVSREPVEPGHARSFETEAYPHFAEIHRAAMRLTRRTAEAEDLTQEVFLQAWKSFARFEPGTNCRAWLYKILWNVHHQHLRKRREVLLSAEEEERLFDTLVARETTPTEIRDEEIAAALESLPKPAREILLLCDVEGFTYREIASILGIPIGTVMSRLSRSRGALRAKLTAAQDAPFAPCPSAR